MQFYSLIGQGSGLGDLIVRYRSDQLPKASRSTMSQATVKRYMQFVGKYHNLHAIDRVREPLLQAQVSKDGRQPARIPGCCTSSTIAITTVRAI